MSASDSSGKDQFGRKPRRHPQRGGERQPVEHRARTCPCTAAWSGHEMNTLMWMTLDSGPFRLANDFEVGQRRFRDPRSRRLQWRRSRSGGVRQTRATVDDLGSGRAERIFKRGDARRSPSNSIGGPTANCCRRTPTRATPGSLAVTRSVVKASSMPLPRGSGAEWSVTSKPFRESIRVN